MRAQVIWLAGISVSLLTGCASEGMKSTAERGMRWEQLADLPDRHGFAAMFAGISNDALIVAGGANFPDKPLWEGGAKVWHDSIFVLEQPGGAWKRAGKLPGALGYGVSITTDRGVFCAGGSNVQSHVKDAFLLTWREGRVERREMPALPAPLANLCGAKIGSTVYVMGGIVAPNATETARSLWAMDLSAESPNWRELEACPGGGRMLATMASDEKSIYVFGGTDLARGADGKPARRYLSDAWRYAPGGGWRKLADLPAASAAAPSPAPMTRDGTILVLGGDDGTMAGIPPQSHPGFPGRIFCYDPPADRWRETGAIPAPRVTAPCVLWRGKWIVVSGEARPGVRSPQIWSLSVE